MFKSLSNSATMLRRTMQQSRDYHIKVCNTVVSKDGRPSNSGHIAIYTTAKEQEEYNLKVSYGQNPVTYAGRPLEHIDVQLQIEGHKEVLYRSFLTPSAGFSNDKFIKEWDRSIDMGPLTAEQAKILAQWRANPKYEVTCDNPDKGTNCVEEVRRVVEVIEGRRLPYVRHETPQALAQRIVGILQTKNKIPT